MAIVNRSRVYPPLAGLPAVFLVRRLYGGVAGWPADHLIAALFTGRRIRSSRPKFISCFRTNVPVHSVAS
jgi:hypothetical protein